MDEVELHLYAFRTHQDPDTVMAKPVDHVARQIAIYKTLRGQNAI